MAAYRDPDDMPVDPDVDDEPAAISSRRFRTVWRPVDPDAYRLARVADDDELAIADSDDAELTRQRASD